MGFIINYLNLFQMNSNSLCQMMNEFPTHEEKRILANDLSKEEQQDKLTFVIKIKSQKRLKLL